MPTIGMRFKNMAAELAPTDFVPIFQRVNAATPPHQMMKIMAMITVKENPGRARPSVNWP